MPGHQVLQRQLAPQLQHLGPQSPTRSSGPHRSQQRRLNRHLRRSSPAARALVHQMQHQMTQMRLEAARRRALLDVPGSSGRPEAFGVEPRLDAAAGLRRCSL